MVATVTRALPRPAHHTAALVTSVVLLVILSFPVTSVPGEPESGPVPGPVSAPQQQEAPAKGTTGGDTPRERAEERADLVAQAKVSVGPPTTTCDQRGVLRDLPDAVPPCVLRLTAWDQPWWPLPLPHPDPVPEQDDTGDLPPTRAPPPTANTLI